MEVSYAIACTGGVLRRDAVDGQDGTRGPLDQRTDLCRIPALQQTSTNSSVGRAHHAEGIPIKPGPADPPVQVAGELLHQHLDGVIESSQRLPPARVATAPGSPDRRPGHSSRLESRGVFAASSEVANASASSARSAYWACTLSYSACALTTRGSVRLPPAAASASSRAFRLATTSFSSASCRLPASPWLSWNVAIASRVGSSILPDGVGSPSAVCIFVMNAGVYRSDCEA